MKKAFAWLNTNWHKAVTAGILLVLAFVLIPFGQNWEIFSVFALTAIGAALLARYDKSKAKFFAPEKGMKILGLVIGAFLIFGFFLPKTGRELWSKVKTLDGDLATASASLDPAKLFSEKSANFPPPCPGVEVVHLGWYDKEYHSSGTVELPSGCSVVVEIHPDPTAKTFLHFDNGPKSDLGIATKSRSWLVKAKDEPPTINVAKDYRLHFWDPKGQSELVLRADRL